MDSSLSYKNLLGKGFEKKFGRACAVTIVFQKKLGILLIEKTLIYLDIDEIDLLFSLYTYKKIKQVWRSRVAVQGDFYARLNRFLAWMYFGIKNPDRYLKAIETNQLKKYQ